MEGFNYHRDAWILKKWDIIQESFLALDNQYLSKEGKDVAPNTIKNLRKLFTDNNLKEALYWLSEKKYDKKEANKYLKLYAKNDPKWKEAFDEVIFIS